MRVLLTGVIGFGVALGLSSLVGWGVNAAPCADAPQEMPSAATRGELLGLAAEPIANQLEQPSDMFTLPGQDALFVVEKPGRIVRVQNGVVQGPPLLDMTPLVLDNRNEQGLLTVLPDSRFEDSCLLYLFYTDVYGDSQLATVRVSGVDPPKADLRTLRHVLEIPQRHDWHQSGSMVFGPDENLWVSVGDGGGIGDPHGHGQNPKTLEGTILRLDVGASSYEIPPDNPFASSSEGRPEVWAYGLRNPWRISIDEESGLLYIPDVGQNEVEEIDVVDWNVGGLNFGWSITEGSGCFETADCTTEGVTQPMYEYSHDGNRCAVVGGRVYRGRAIPELAGEYFFGDYCGGWIRSLRYADGQIVSMSEWSDLGEHRLLTSIRADEEGELYLMTLDGGLWKIVPVREASND